MTGNSRQVFSLYHITEGTANFKNLGATTPDDYLAKLSDELIPVRPRGADFHLPETDLLKSIHYYVAHKYQDHFGLFDETALLALGYLVEHWIEEELQHKTHMLYAQKEGTEEALEQQNLRKEVIKKKAAIRRHERLLNNPPELKRKRTRESDDESDADTTEKKNSSNIKRKHEKEKRLKDSFSTPILVKCKRLKKVLSSRSRESTPTNDPTP